MLEMRMPTLTVPAFEGKSGLAAGIDPLSNSSMLDAMDDESETRYLLMSEPTNAAHSLRSIKQYRRGKNRVVGKL